MSQPRSICLAMVILCYCFSSAQAADPMRPATYQIYVVNPISNEEILPTTGLKGLPDNRLSLHGCPDQYISASFVLHSEGKVAGLLATPSKLKSDSNSIPASAVDIRVVKCWYQSGVRESNVRQAGKRILTPELLLKNDGLVRVDPVTQQNYLRLADGRQVCISGDAQETPELIRPTDASTLQPVNISPNVNKQFWMTIHIPVDAGAGDYVGTIALNSHGSPAQYVHISLTVHDFPLEQPKLIYGMIYNGQINNRYPGGAIGHPWKSAGQYTAEMSDLLQHGIRYPGFNYYWGDPACDPEVNLKIHDNLSFPKDYLFFYTGMGAKPPITVEELNRWRHTVQTIKKISDRHGYKKVFCFAVDEAPSDIMHREIPALQIVHEEGGYNYIATNAGNHPFDIVGDYVDIADYAWEPNAVEAAKWHGKGAKIFSYANPQTANENPYTYRRNYGWLLFKNNYDGTFICSYQGNYGQHIWNDFSVPVGGYRGHNLTYPTTNGVVGTLQYEGLREAINDMRYLATLQKMIMGHQQSKPALTAAAQSWINNVNLNDDLDALRLKMAEWINQLRKQESH